MKNCKYVKYILIAALVVLLIPIILNWLLRWNTNTDIITDNNGPATWLIFWGSYLSAIGATIMALVSLLQNKSERARNKTRILYERKLENYKLLEAFVADQNDLYSTYQYTSIIKKMNKDDDNLEAKIEYERWYNKILFASIYSIRVLQPLQAYRTDTMQKYGNELKKLNTDTLANCQALYNMMKNGIPKICEYGGVVTVTDAIDTTAFQIDPNQNMQLQNIGFTMLYDYMLDIKDITKKL